MVCTIIFTYRTWRIARSYPADIKLYKTACGVRVRSFGIQYIFRLDVDFGNLGMPALGIEGAAIATVIAEYVGAIYISVIFLPVKGFLQDQTGMM